MFLGQLADAATILAVLVACATIYQAGRLQRKISQPYVVVFMEVKKEGTPTIYIVVKNHGRTAAGNIRFSFRPQPRVASARIGGRAQPAGAPLGLPDELPTLVPGQEWRTVWDLGPSYLASDLPREHTVEVSYKGIGRKRQQQLYVLDWEALNSQLY